MFSKKCYLCKTTYCGDLSEYFYSNVRRGKQAFQCYCKKCHAHHYRNNKNVGIGEEAREENRRKNKENFTIRARNMANSAKVRAGRKGIEITIDAGFIENLFVLQDHKCCLTGIEFDLKDCEGLRRNPMSPSLDRIDNRRGYTPDNVRLILTCVNIALNEWGQSVLDTWTAGYMSKKLS